MTAVNYAGYRICHVDAKGLHVLRTKAKSYGYKIIKIEDAMEGISGYIVTMEKIKKLRHYPQNEPMKETA